MTALPYAMQDKVNMPNPYARRLSRALRCWLPIMAILAVVAAITA